MHPDVVNATLAAVFLGVLAICYVWTINDIFSEVHRALTYSLPKTSDAFDLAGAAKLGLNSSSTASSTATTTAP